MERCRRRSTLSLPIFFMLVSSSSSATAATAKYSITPTAPLADNETLVCASEAFSVGFFTPTGSNNSYIGLWYNQISEPHGHTILWVANRQNPVVGGSSGALLSVTLDGRLTITSSDKKVVWTSPASTVKITSAVAQLLDNGNLVVKQDGDVNDNYGWQGFNYLTDTMIPGMKIGLDRTTGINRTVVAWASATDPSPGAYRAFLNINGDPEVYVYQGSDPKFRSGSLDITNVSVFQNTKPFQDVGIEYANNDKEVTYSYSNTVKTSVMRIILNYTGVVQVAVWMWDTNQWKNFLTLPKDNCDGFGYCGPFGHCDSNTSPLCSCLPGFVPKDPSSLIVSGGSNSCVRKHELGCSRNGSTDGFNTVSNVKLPQSENCVVHVSMDLARCEQLCRLNCSCTAYTTAYASQGGDKCLIWVGDRLSDIRNIISGVQDLHVRVAAPDVVRIKSTPLSPPVSTVGLAPAHYQKMVTTMAITVSSISAMLLLACIGCFTWKRKKRKDADIHFNKQLHREAEENDVDLPVFGFDTIATATNCFSPENKLGEGGFGPVYKGHLGESQEIAVKRLAKTSQQGTDEFKNEAKLIAKLQHRNLVRLLGCCIHGEERILIYEYMPNKSLDAFLFDKEKCASLDWNTRYQIIIGITRGLRYLHHDSRFRIIHRDLKAGNILLDKEMNPKISDFGMARIFSGDQTDFNTRKVVGTYGYMSPEYAMDGIFSMKSDVYSFGVLVLEIISGRRNRGAYTFSPHLNLVAHAWSLWNEGRSLEIAHKSMINDGFPDDEALKFIKVGLLCVQKHPEDRPLMSSVVVMLSRASDIASLPQPKQPGFTAYKCPEELRHEPPASNGLTISMEGR